MALTLFLDNPQLLNFSALSATKKSSKVTLLSYTEGVRQAKDYAQRLQCRFGYSTNGHDIYQIDMHTGEEKLVDRFLTPEEMWAITFNGDDGVSEPEYTSTWRTRFASIPFECKGDWQPRYYQENAINQTLEAIAQGKAS